MARNTKSGVGKLNRVVCLLKSVHYLSIFILTDSCSSEAAMSTGQLLLSSCYECWTAVAKQLHSGGSDSSEDRLGEEGHVDGKRVHLVRL